MVKVLLGLFGLLAPIGVIALIDMLLTKPEAANK